MNGQEEIKVYTDGSTKNNGSPNAKGASACIFPNGEIPDGAYYLPDKSEIRTNNKMEYYAAIKAMELVNEFDPSGTRVLHIFTDSMLLLNTCTKWMISWYKKGWKKSTPGEIKNLDMVKRLYDLCNSRTVRWTHVRAHQRDDSFETIWNNKVDKLAYSTVDGDDISHVIVPQKPETPRIDTFFNVKKRRTK